MRNKQRQFYKQADTSKKKSYCVRFFLGTYIFQKIKVEHPD